MGRPWNTGSGGRGHEANQAKLVWDGSIHLTPNEAREVNSSMVPASMTYHYSEDQGLDHRTRHDWPTPLCPQAHAFGSPQNRIIFEAS